MRRRRVLAVASKGGHWTELRQLRGAFADAEVTWVTTDPAYGHEVGNDGFYAVGDASRWDKLALLRTTLQLTYVVARTRPTCVISTGAAPGLLAAWLAKRIGARVLWLDSIANADELSLSGAKAGAFADVWLTQWEHLARPEGPHYEGQVL